MRFTNKQKSLLLSQIEDPIFMCEDETSGKVNFGLIRLGIVNIHITLSLRPLYERGFILETEVEHYIYKGVGDQRKSVKVKQVFIKTL
jgi:hypothetical protein